MNNISKAMLKEVASLKNPLIFCSDKGEEMLSILFFSFVTCCQWSDFLVNTMFYLICKRSSSQVLQIQLIAQPHEEGAEPELYIRKVPVLCVVPCECKLKRHLYTIQILDT